ncbi:MAG: hypothetical protein HRU12_03775 [Phaeodactylibacter sp.]|nr:hypothetical protein [Phaeodactylibacter sp.]
MGFNSTLGSLFSPFSSKLLLESPVAATPPPPLTAFYLEMECGNLGSAWETIADASASAGNYVVISAYGRFNTAAITADDIITLPFLIEEGGDYRLWGRVDSPTQSNDSFWVSLNGGAWTRWNNPNVGVGFTWSESPFSTFSLAVGSHEIRVAVREKETRLDKLYITKDGDTPSEIGGAGINC